MLNSSGDIGHPCRVAEFRENSFYFSALRKMFLWVFTCRFILFRYIPSRPAFWQDFITNGHWIRQKHCLSLLRKILCLSFNLLIWCITLICLQILKNPWIPGIKPTWSRCVIFSICWWICLVEFVWGFCIYVHQWLCLWFSFLVTLLPGFGIGVMLVLQNEFGHLSSSVIFWKHLSRICFCSPLSLW